MSDQIAMPVSEELLRQLLARVGVEVTKIVAAGHDIVITGRIGKLKPSGKRAAGFRRKGEPEARLEASISGKELEAPLSQLPSINLGEAMARLPVPPDGPLNPDVLALMGQLGRGSSPAASPAKEYDPLDAFRTR